MATRRLPLQRSRNRSARFNLIFFSFFLLIGSVVACFFVVMALRDVETYFRYEAGGCTITARRIIERQGDDGPTYAPYFEFTVQTIDGRYPAAGYRRMQIFTSVRSGVEATVNRYEIGGSYPCWYNPDDPTQAVLERGPNWFYLFGLVPLVFVGIGLAGITVSVYRSRRSPEALAPPIKADEAVQKLLPALRFTPGRYLAIRLPAQQGHKAKLAGLIIFAVLWNGITYAVMSGLLLASDSPVWVWMLLSVFALVGLAVIFLVVRQILVVLTAGETTVELSEEPLNPGQTVQLHVAQRGSMEIQQLQVKLICREKVTYRRGTNVYHDEKSVIDTLLFEQTNFSVHRSSPWQQSLSLTVPADAMHSFKSRNNEITWQAVVKVKVAQAPDFEMAFPFR
ncbi:MAG: DUF3592 domain-containing protein, partial [Anaerolineae bacterium]